MKKRCRAFTAALTRWPSSPFDEKQTDHLSQKIWAAAAAGVINDGFSPVFTQSHLKTSCHSGWIFMLRQSVQISSELRSKFWFNLFNYREKLVKV